jgi:hypothetical protein
MESLRPSVRKKSFMYSSLRVRVGGYRAAHGLAHEQRLD